jgi:hypothetical protein
MTDDRFTRADSTYYEKALQRLQELENKLESGQLVELEPTLTDLRLKIKNLKNEAEDMTYECMAKPRGRCNAKLIYYGEIRYYDGKADAFLKVANMLEDLEYMAKEKLRNKNEES